MSSGSVLTVRSLSPSLSLRCSFMPSGSVKVATSLGAADGGGVGVVEGVVGTGSVSVGVARDDRGLWRRCHCRLSAIAEEKDRRRGGEPDQQQKHECGDGPPPLDGRPAGLGGGDR